MFNAITDKQGLLNLNKFIFILHKSKDQDKPIVISHVPIMIQVEI